MSNFPKGTVTLLFTDIEGSTRLLQQLGERYAGVLAECRQLLRTVFYQWNGHEVDTQGDSFFVVFARATDAISAAVVMQCALATYAWPDGVTILVRIGLHTGEPMHSAESYIGLDVHHAARIMSVGHGGQVLLSQTTCELVKQNLPDGVSLRDLGEHRLKDLQRPGRLYQLVMTGLPADFPPLKSLNNRPNNLPIQLTQLIGREQEVSTALNFLQREHVRLLTLTGPGGTGKTRLALQVAAELSEAFSDGVYFVNLAPISDPELVVPTIAQTLDIKEIADQTLLNLLKASLHWKHVLLLLDNFEQVAGAAVYVAELLAACPLLKVLVTSRAALHIRGEQEFAVPPLAVPDPKHLPDLVALAQYEAVALFIRRAQAVKPDFQVTNANAQAVAEICVRLDGLPLAIELVAARIKVLPPQALLARLDQRLAVLTGGAQDAPARQQTLRNTIEWSYQLLNAEQQRLFWRLAVFAGGCTLEAIEAVYTELNGLAGQVLDGVASLIDKSLLQQTEHEDGEPRFVMLESIREYGLERLRENGEMEVTWQAHALYYLALAEKAEPNLKGQQQVMWLERLEQEHDNLRVAMRWTLERWKAWNHKEMALRLGGALSAFWQICGYYSEGQVFLERALQGSEEVTTSVRGRVLNAAAEFALLHGDNDLAKVRFEECLLFFRKLGDTRNIANSLIGLGSVAWNKGKLAEARSLFEEALVLFRKTGDNTSIAWALSQLGGLVGLQGEYAKGYTLCEESLALNKAHENKSGIANSLLQMAAIIYISQGDSEKAYRMARESLKLNKERGDILEIAVSLGYMGQIALSQGNVATARSMVEESLVLCKKIGHRKGNAWLLSLLGKVYAEQGEYSTANALFVESLELTREIGDKELIAPNLERLAEVIAELGEPVQAANLWGAAEVLRDTMGAPIPPIERAGYKDSVAAARSKVGENAFATAWAEGRTMTLDQALTAQGQTLDSSLSSKGERTAALPATSTVTYPDDLTPREVEVLHLVAMGLTDAQIAEQLVISPRTVNSHLTSIYRKIVVSSRSAATRYAIEHHLV